jgi:hypothetical protein
MPFGIYENNFSSFWYLAVFLLPFGFLWSAVSYLLDFIMNRATSFESEKDYKKDFFIWLLKILVLIHVFFVLRGILCDWKCVDLYEYLELWSACLLIMAFTYFPFMLYGKYLYYHGLVGKEASNSDSINLSGEGKEELTLNKDNIIYLKSDDNYVDIHFINETNQIEKVVIRATLKFLENQLAEHRQFVRIHRSYLVNIHYALATRKRDTILMKYNSFSEDLPVSRKYQTSLSNLFIRHK